MESNERYNNATKEIDEYLNTHECKNKYNLSYIDTIKEIDAYFSK